MTRLHSTKLIDYHTHTGVTVDAKMTETDACAQALARGVHEIAFTNHIMLNQPAYIMTPEACVVHWERIQACQKQYRGLKIRLGLEVDYYPGREDDIRRMLSEYESRLGRKFDLVLGSIHELNGVFFSNQHHAPALFEDQDPVSLYCDYFAVATMAVRSGLFDIMAHPDLIKKYTYELNPPVPFAQYRQAVIPYIDALLETDTGMEINTKGVRLKVSEPYPSKELLELYLARASTAGQQPILTIGSDAHLPGDVGDHLQEAALLLRGLGVTELARFEGRRRSPWRL